ncbi:MAG: hypothetical protein AAFU66_05810, partial [Pseudomonadota bacterium]
MPKKERIKSVSNQPYEGVQPGFLDNDGEIGLPNPGETDRGGSRIDPQDPSVTTHPQPTPPVVEAADTQVDRKWMMTFYAAASIVAAYIIALIALGFLIKNAGEDWGRYLILLAGIEAIAFTGAGF